MTTDDRASACPWRRDVTGGESRRSYAGTRLRRRFCAVVRRRGRGQRRRLVAGVVSTGQSPTKQQVVDQQADGVVVSASDTRLGQGCTVASSGSVARGPQNYMKLNLFVAHIMTRNNTMNEVHIAATELPQLLLSVSYLLLESEP